MGDFAVVSDLHFNPWSTFGKFTEDGTSSRLLDNLAEFDRMMTHAFDRDINLTLICGDVHHKRGWLNVTVNNLVTECLLKWTKRGMRFVAIPGNHDRASRSQLAHGLVPLSHFDGIYILDEGEWFIDEDLELFVGGIGYMDVDSFGRAAERLESEVSSWLEFQRVCMIHQDLRGALTHTGFTVESGIPPKDIEKMLPSFEMIFFGHYHCWQDLSERMFGIGALTQHSFGDRDQFRGGAIVTDDTEDGSVDVILLESDSPKFFELYLGDDVDSTHFAIFGETGSELLLPGDVRAEKDFVRLIFPDTPSDALQDTIRSTISHVAIVTQGVTEKTRSNDSFSPSMSIEQMMTRYVEASNPAGLDNDRLAKLIPELLDK